MGERLKSFLTVALTIPFMVTELKFNHKEPRKPDQLNYEILHMNQAKPDRYIFDAKRGIYRLPYDPDTGIYTLPPNTCVLFQIGDYYYLVKDTGSRSSVFLGLERPEQTEDGDWTMPKIRQQVPLDHDKHRQIIGDMEVRLRLDTVFLRSVARSYNPPLNHDRQSRKALNTW